VRDTARGAWLVGWRHEIGCVLEQAQQFDHLLERPAFEVHRANEGHSVMLTRCLEHAAARVQREREIGAVRANIDRRTRHITPWLERPGRAAVGCALLEFGLGSGRRCRRCRWWLGGMPSNLGPALCVSSLHRVHRDRERFFT